LIITAPGIAISDGVEGQQIPVKNASSQRVIHATVVAPGQVIVQF
jgi:flagella basal body P-ring formation protein FlgA